MSILNLKLSMKKPFFWENAKKHLIKKDKMLGNIIKSYPRDFLFSKSDPFFTLSRAIIGQQISVKAAESVWNKFEKKIKTIDPINTKNMHYMKLKSCGLSRQKIKYLKSLSDAFLNGSIKPNKWVDCEDEEIIQESHFCLRTLQNIICVNLFLFHVLQMISL